MASVNDIVTTTGTSAWQGSFVYKVKSITNDVVLLHLADASTFAFHSGDHAIQFDQSTGIWSDVNNSTDPKYFSSTSTFANNTSLSGYPSNIYCWSGDSTPILRLILVAPSWATSGGGTNTEGVVTPSGSLTYRNGTVYITIDPASPTTSTIHKYGIQEDGVWFGLSADTIPHTQGQYTSDSVSGSLGSVYSLKYTNTDGTSSTIALATITATKGSKVFCNF